MPVAPAPVPLSLAGLGALAVNLSCAFMLARYRHHSGSLTKATFLSARNDAIANIAIIAAGLVTAFLWRSAWPDLIVGLAIAVMNADAARKTIREIRALTSKPFNINVFCHAPAMADEAIEREWIDWLVPHFAKFGTTPPERLKEIYTSFMGD